MHHGFRRGGEGEARYDDGVASPDAVGHERHDQRVGAAGTRDRVTRPYVRREAFLELRHLRPEDESTVLDHAGDGGLDPAAEATPLAGEVDEGDVRHPRFL
jgi:hypothetical protein